MCYILLEKGRQILASGVVAELRLLSYPISAFCRSWLSRDEG